MALKNNERTCKYRVSKLVKTIQQVINVKNNRTVRWSVREHKTKIHKLHVNRIKRNV